MMTVREYYEKKELVDLELAKLEKIALVYLTGVDIKNVENFINIIVDELDEQIKEISIMNNTNWELEDFLGKDEYEELKRQRIKY